MSCNGCRVLRKGCSQDCALRACLQWIHSPHSQAHATLFLAKFFGRSDLMSFISSVPVPTRPVLFRSLLYEACGRTVNPVNGAVGLLWSGNWHVCEAAFQTILAGGVLGPLPETFDGVLRPILGESSSDIGRTVRFQSRPFMQDLGEMEQKSAWDLSLLSESYNNKRPGTGSVATVLRRQSNPTMSPVVSVESGMRSGGSCGDEKSAKLLDLFV